MPGPTRFRKISAIQEALKSGKLDIKSIDRSALAVLKFLKRMGKFEHPEIPPEKAIDNPAHRKLIRQAGADGVVVLKNDKNILPLKANELKSVAILGLAKECMAYGGGSAAIPAHYKITPYEALEKRLDGVDIRYSQGQFHNQVSV